MNNLKIKKALEYSYLLLRNKDRTEKEIASFLDNKNYDSDTIKEVIKKLKEKNLINDEKFVRNFVSRELEKGKGLSLIIFELTEKGIERSKVEKILKELNITEETEYSFAEKLFKKKIIKYNNKSFDERMYRRLADFFSRRGFSSDTIEKLFRNFRKDIDTDE
ncbi:MAG: regulatory protein RecX [Endomicrobiia bacterium]